jgi:hypothetical protein
LAPKPATSVPAVVEAGGKPIVSTAGSTQIPATIPLPSNGSETEQAKSPAETEPSKKDSDQSN